MDKNREKRKRIRAVLSFVIMTLGLVVLFFAAINIGSLKVSFGELMRGLFVERIDAVATIYDLRFPRIIISMLAGAAIAVSGVLFQAVLKNPLADPGIIGISSGASFAAVLITAFAPQLYFFTPLLCTDRDRSWCDRISDGVLSVMEGRLKPSSHYSDRCGCGCVFYRTFQCVQQHERRKYVRCGIHRRGEHYTENMG